MIRLSFFFIVSCGLLACSGNKLKIDISKEQLSLNLRRLDEEIMTCPSSKLAKKHEQLSIELGKFYQLYFGYALGGGNVDNDQALSFLESFRNHKDNQFVYDAIQTKFGNLNDYLQELTIAFKHYKHYFPDSIIPNIITLQGNFSGPCIPGNEDLGICLDWFLGSHSEVIELLPPSDFPLYTKNKMDEMYLSSNAMYYWLKSKFWNDQHDDFLHAIINEGKIMLLMDAMMPELADSIKIEFSKDELEWCKASETSIWSYIIDNNILYSKDESVIKQFTTYAPFTKGLPDTSPGRVGIWLGWQIIKDYFEHKDLSIIEVINENNLSKILKTYNPND